MLSIRKWMAGLPVRPTPEKSGFAKDAKGSTAIEFTVIIMPFLVIFLGLIQTGMIFLSSLVLENGTAEVTRMVRTGEVQTQGLSKSAVTDRICSYVDILLDCSKLQLSMQTFENYSILDSGSALDADGNLRTDFSFDPGGPFDIVLTQVFYPMDLFFMMPGVNTGDMAGTDWLLAAAVVHQNEPYPEP